MKAVFITGGTGYIGKSVVEAALHQGLDVRVLTRSTQKAKRLKKLGVIPVIGDLHVDGPWQTELQKAEFVIHLASPPTWGKKVTRKIADHFKEEHLALTRRLFQNINPDTVKKIVFVAGTSYLGDAGNGVRVNESFKSSPKGWGPYIAPSVELVRDYATKGLPVVFALPGQVYGPDSWLPQLYLEPLYYNKPVTALKSYNPLFSPVHIEDCGRALIFLLEKGLCGEIYFIVDDRTLPSLDFMEIAAQIMGVRSKVRTVPRWVCSLLLGSVLTEYATVHTNFSNRKLKNLGFKYFYPTCTEGLEQVIKEWTKKKSKELGA